MAGQLVSSNESLLALCEKFIAVHCKVLRDLLDQHPFSFVPFIRLTVDFVLHFLFHAENRILLFDSFVVQCLNLVKGIVLCAEYKPAKVIEGESNVSGLKFTIYEFVQLSAIPELAYPIVTYHLTMGLARFQDKTCQLLIKGVKMWALIGWANSASILQLINFTDADTKEAATLEAYRIKLEVFTPDVVSQMGRQLIEHYLLLSQENLHSWESNPEEFGTDC